MASNRFDRLRQLYGEIADLRHAESLLSWDQQTYMPPRGAEARGLQLATLSGLIHEKMVSPLLGDLLDEAEALPRLSAEEKAFLRELRFERDRSMKLPQSLVKELALETSRAFTVWTQARNQKNFRTFAPSLRRVTDLTKQAARCWGHEGTPWNALATAYERNLTAERVTEILTPLRDATIKLLERISSCTRIDKKTLDQKWDTAAQREFGLRVARDIGFDMASGRLDTAPHPFCTTIGAGDVRITTRYSENNLVDAALSTMHETGHALYDLGVKPAFARTPLDGGVSLGIHESQSRFWEVRVGHSEPFWRYYLPILRQSFPGRLDGVTPDQFHRLINRVEPDFIRVEADEVCYNLHIIIRFELEVRIFDNQLAIDDLPTAWNELYEKYLGLRVPDDSKGCLQDVHWAYGSYGYFPTYSLGNIYNAMFVEKMQQDMPDMWDQVAAGRFTEILAWLRENIHQHGRMYLPDELVQRVTGRAITCEPLVRHLNEKYARLYGF